MESVSNDYSPLGEEDEDERLAGMELEFVSGDDQPIRRL